MKIREILSIFKNKIKLNPAAKEKTSEEKVEHIFQELNDINSKRDRLKNYIKRMQQRKKDLKQYESLSKEDYIKVTKHLNQYKNILEQRKLLEGRLIRNNPSLRIIQNFEKEMPEFIKEIRQTEAKQRYAKTDILYLRQEKDQLYDYRETLITGYRALKTISIILIIILGLTSIALLTMVQALEKNILIPSSIVLSASLIIGFGILIVKGKIEYELELNELMQKKASRLLNKTKIKYFHHTNYLNYQYERLSIKNSDHLQAQYERYIKNKDNETKYQNMNNQLIEIEENVFDILYDKGIDRDVFDNLEEWAEIQNIEVLLKNIDIQIKNTNEQIESLEQYEQELLKEAFVITKTEPSIKPRVERLLKSYNSRK